MSVETVNQFYQEVMQEPALLEKFQSAPDQESLANLAVEVGQQKGYSFTVDEVEQALAAQNAASETGELSDEQLEAVAGGWWTDDQVRTILEENFNNATFADVVRIGQMGNRTFPEDFNRGQEPRWDPNLIAHERTHVLQQGGMSRPPGRGRR